MVTTGCPLAACKQGGLGATYLVGCALVQFDSLVPFVHVVRVLSQQHAVEQKGPAGDQLLEAGQPQLQVYVVYTGQGGKHKRGMMSVCEVQTVYWERVFVQTTVALQLNT